MKNILSLVLFTIISVLSANAQISHVYMNVNGDMDIKIRIAERGFIILSETGEVLDMMPEDGEISYYDRWNIDTTNENKGKIESIGGVKIEYYTKWDTDTTDENRGKISKIGNISIEYYTKWSTDTTGENRGKVAKIGSVEIEYYTKWDTDTTDENRGKVAKVGSEEYEYYTKWSTRTNDYNRGRLMSGRRMFQINGIAFSVKEMY